MPQSNHSILLVEDDASLRNALSTKLSREGYTVLQAGNGVEGMEIALSKHPQLIFLDINMPVMTGPEMLTLLRKDPWGSMVKVVMLTNLDDTSHIADAAENNVLGYVVKSTASLVKILEIAQRYVPLK